MLGLVRIEDGETIPNGTTIETDLAIIGAGAAGITIASELARSRIKVLLIESGGWEPEDRFQELSRGEIAGHPYWPLEDNRRRCIGGTTQHWSGWCRPLDELDLATRDWVPRSGWPITRDSLLPFYRRAHDICQLGPWDYDVQTWEGRMRTQRLALDKRIVITKMFRLSPPTRFGPTYVPSLLESDNVHVIYHASVLDIETTPEATAVSALKVGTLDGRRFRIQARAYVLAAGGLENARLLLLSNRQQPVSLGNEHDQVGRYFMEHLNFSFGLAILRKQVKGFEALYSPHGRHASARIFPSNQLQRDRRLLRSNVILDPVIQDDSRNRHLSLHKLRARLRGATIMRLRHTVEQPPEPDSRVTLGSGRDAFGLRRIRLTWRVGTAEQQTFRHTWRAFDRALKAAGLGHIVIPRGDDENEWPPSELQGHRGHHMGTTRMSSEPKLGVVDVNCRVHGVANLYVGGSSVFPTAGAGTPTLSIVALAVRLAEHLLSRI